MIMVGTKKDLRNSGDAFTSADLEAKKTEMGMQAVCETSSKEWHDDAVNLAF